MEKVSVLIPTYKRAYNLLRCLESVRLQSHPADQVLIIDGDSGDELGVYLKWHFKAALNYKIIKSKKGLTRQRNAGIRASSGDIIIFIDDDVILDADYIKEISAVFKLYPQNIGGVSGLVVEKDRRLNKFFKAAHLAYASLFFLFHEADGKFLASGFATRCDFSRCKEITPVEFLLGCNMAFKREIFNEFQFDENLYRYMYLEDDDIAYRVSRKYQNYWTPHAKLVHTGPYEKRNDYIRAQALFHNYLYLHKKNIPKTVSNRAIFVFAIIGWLNLEFILGALNLDLSRFLGMISNFIFWKRRENDE